MSNFSDFRRALDGVVFGNPSRRNPQARRNMAIKKHGGTFDTVEELVAYEKAMGLAAPYPKKAPRKPAAPAPAPTPRAPAAPRAPFTGELRDPSGPPSYGQAKTIVLSMGGIDKFCPGLAGHAVPGGTSLFALKRLGLTKEAASRVIDAMTLQGVLYAKTAQGQAAAREILEIVGGVSCAVPAPSATSNPMFYGKKKLPKGAMPVQARVAVVHGNLCSTLDFRTAQGGADQLIVPFPVTAAGLRSARTWAASFGVPVADSTGMMRGQDVRDRELARATAAKKKAAAKKRAATIKAKKKKAAANPGRYQARGREF